MAAQISANCSRSRACSRSPSLRNSGPRVREVFSRGTQKSNQHLAALRIFFDLDDVTKSTALQRQLTDATQQEKRRPDARTYGLNVDLDHRRALAPLDLAHFDVHLCVAEAFRITFKELSVGQRFPSRKHQQGYEHAAQVGAARLRGASSTSIHFEHQCT